jgi:oxygen-dependent protoporphyrinogen oxidase
MSAGLFWEDGPNSFQPADTILTVACDAGLGDKILLADPDSDRFGRGDIDNMHVT